MDGSTLVNKPLEPDFASSINFSSSALDPFFFKGPPGGEITALTTCFFVLAVVALLARSPCPSSSFNNTKQKQKNCQSRQKNEEEHCYYYYVFLVVTITIPISTSSRLANGFKKTIETKICSSSSSSSLFSKRFFSYQSDVGKIAQKHDQSFHGHDSYTALPTRTADLCEHALDRAFAEIELHLTRSLFCFLCALPFCISLRGPRRSLLASGRFFSRLCGQIEALLWQKRARFDDLELEARRLIYSIFPRNETRRAREKRKLGL